MHWLATGTGRDRGRCCGRGKCVGVRSAWLALRWLGTVAERLIDQVSGSQGTVLSLCGRLRSNLPQLKGLPVSRRRTTDVSPKPHEVRTVPCIGWPPALVVIARCRGMGKCVW